MNVILLSGGSGKRLWPLSNDIRSKQFIKLFRNGENEYESMLQRVYRQIKGSDPDADITIATGKSQVSTILNQVGEKISVCVEPCRRDTFPAIALACAFLSDVKGVSEDEVITVCPVDPYVEADYFKAVHALSELAKNSECNLSLLGVEPTYPSAKYGYIIPETADRVSRVMTFKEKPSEDDAAAYIKDGALWNCGVFAFRLGYILNIARTQIGFRDYSDLKQKYGSLEKISFDYAVSEKEKSIQVLRFSGRWKDIGTWNTFTEEMSEKTIGNVILGPGSDNTNVINELNIPILAVGIPNAVIAASGDGILVSNKKQSSYIKPFVDSIEQTVMYAEKSWGSFTVLDLQNDSMTIKIKLNKGHGLHYHSHEFRDEVWNVVTGTGRTVIDGIVRTVRPGDIIHLPAGSKHTVYAYTDQSIIEIQFGSEISVHDKKKFYLDPEILGE